MGHVRISGKRSYAMTPSAAACLIEFPKTPHTPDKCTFLRSVHLLFPFADGGNIGLVRQIFQTHDFLRRKSNACCFNSIFYMAYLRHADNGQRPLGNGPSCTDLRRRKAMSLTDFFHCCHKFCKLRQDGVIGLGAIRAVRERMLCVIFAGKSTLLQYHVGKEYNAVFLAVVQNAGAFRGTVEQAEVILHSLYLAARFL